MLAPILLVAFSGKRSELNYDKKWYLSVTAVFTGLDKKSHIVSWTPFFMRFCVSLSNLSKIYQYFWRVRLEDSNTRIRRLI